MSFMIYKMMFKGETFYVKWKLFYYQLSWKHHQAARVQKEFLEIWKRSNPSQIWGIQEVLLHGFVSFLRKVNRIFFMDSIVKRWRRADWTFVHGHLKGKNTTLIAEGTKHIKKTCFQQTILECYIKSENKDVS